MSKTGEVRPHLSVVILAAVVALGCGPGASAAPVIDETRSEISLGELLEWLFGDQGNDDPPPPPPVALALEIEQGEGVPLTVMAGQEFYVNQLDLRAFVATTTDQGVEILDETGPFADLSWRGVEYVEEDTAILGNPDGTFTRRRFYRGAKWMESPSHFTIEQLDADGRRIPTRPVILHTGREDRLRPSDSFFIRRLRAIQWTNDCPSYTDCSGTDDFLAEALVELRNARDGAQSFVMNEETAALRLRWTALPRETFTIPVTQVQNPEYAYGFDIDVEPVTAPRADGSYAPGTDITFQVTLRDGAGQRLHPPGELPTYADVAFGPNPAGIQYYLAFFDPTITYYRRKHRERMMMASISGPVQDIQPINTIVQLPAFLGPDDVQTTALPERDGFFGQFMTFPPANDLFGGAFDPTNAGWFVPVSDTWTFSLPEDAAPGTYLVSLKGRRFYLGEDIPVTTNVEIQVGTPEPTSPNLTVGNCSTCHNEGGELASVLHANDNLASCSGCHAPLAFEYDGPIPVRVHFIHSRSERFEAPLEQCSTCHLNEEGIQRTSKAACLSCHTSYPDSHVAAFGDDTNMFVGGEAESFQQCTSGCHTTHPGSAL